jgi:hypothetical protein
MKYIKKHYCRLPYAQRHQNIPGMPESDIFRTNAESFEDARESNFFLEDLTPTLLYN